MVLNRAKIIAKKYNCSFDYIYRITDNAERISQFMVDIRDIISCIDDKITIKINNIYWKYLKDRTLIEKSIDTEDNKKQHLAELNSHFNLNCDEFIWKTNILSSYFSQYFVCDGKYIPYIFTDEKSDRKKVTDEEYTKVQNFIKEISKNNIEENE